MKKKKKEKRKKRKRKKKKRKEKKNNRSPHLIWSKINKNETKQNKQKTHNKMINLAWLTVATTLIGHSSAIVCSAGEYADSNSVCQQCPEGQYQGSNTDDDPQCGECTPESMLQVQAHPVVQIVRLVNSKIMNPQQHAPAARALLVENMWE